MAIRLMVLNDEETCTNVEGCAVVEFENDRDADDFADFGTNEFELQNTGLTAEVPIMKAVRRPVVHGRFV